MSTGEADEQVEDEQRHHRGHGQAAAQPDDDVGPHDAHDRPRGAEAEYVGRAQQVGADAARQPGDQVEGQEAGLAQQHLDAPGRR